MNKTGLRAYLLCSTLLCAAASAGAIDLAQAVDLAAARDPGLRAGRHAFNANQELTQQARAAMLPTLSIVGTPSHIKGTIAFFDSEPVPRSFNSTTWNIKLNQPVFRAQHWIAYSRSAAQVAQAEIRYRIAQRDLSLRICQAYFDMVTAQDDAIVALSQELLARDKVSLGRDGVVIGQASLTELGESQIALQRSRIDRRKMLGAYAEKKSDLESLVREPVATIVKISNKKNLEFAPQLLSSVEQWTAQAEDSALEVQLKALAVVIAAYDVKMQWAANLPTVDLTLTRGRFVEGGNIDLPLSASTVTRSTVLGLQINIPIVNGGDTLSRMRQTGELKAQAEEELEAARIETRQKVKNAVAAFRRTESQIQDLLVAVRLAEDLLVEAESAYTMGARTQSHVANAQLRVQALYRDLNRARYEALLQGIRLKAFAGSLYPEEFAQVGKMIRQNGEAYRSEEFDRLSEQ
ncbi:TolC family protein [Rugamonas sp. CCM 8940]|uniref:TolC family protein n=1 Tax=Rugamonas sp. CCM 8940 TaxID=2765359 RepID=UPI0018F3C6C5|nr:TolC family protein [Rugamonas sp. CCM 8940]MBJ7308927.1 TolC family protein [Rugamonas sp. CCM 8940]